MFVEKANIFSNFNKNHQTENPISCETPLSMNNCCKTSFTKSILISATISYDNQLFAPFIIHNVIHTIIVTNNWLSNLI